MGRRPDLIRVLIVVFAVGLGVTGVSSLWQDHMEHRSEQAQQAPVVHKNAQHQVVASAFQNNYPRD